MLHPPNTHTEFLSGEPGGNSYVLCVGPLRRALGKAERRRAEVLRISFFLCSS